MLPQFTQYVLFYLQPQSKSPETDIFHVESIMWQNAMFTSIPKKMYKTSLETQLAYFTALLNFWNNMDFRSLYFNISTSNILKRHY